MKTWVNAGRRMLEDAGHDVMTVGDQGLAGAADPRVIEVCKAERRCLVTLDLDFSNPFVFPPEQYAGIAVLRLPRRPSPTTLYKTLGTLVNTLAKREIEGKLWIVERLWIREYQPAEDPNQAEGDLA